MLKSKGIRAPKEESDGLRISIMSRHTLEDGKTPDDTITPDMFDNHLPEFAAPGKFVGAYYRGELSFDEYSSHYIDHLKNTQKDKIIALVRDALVNNITVMCTEETPEHCHRRLFIEYSKAIADSLGLNLKVKIE